jgi:AcrR family transcriptional regulator
VVVESEPLYERLPHGPHKLTEDSVKRNQRVRIYGAMLEAIAQGSYQRTSVKNVIAMAGVSRRSFYEQFANKDQCFLAICYMILLRLTERIDKTCQSVEGGLEDSLQVALLTLANEVLEDPALARLLLVEAQEVGLTATPQMYTGALRLEQMIADAFKQATEGASLPLPVARAMIGGLQRVMYLRLRMCSIEEFAQVIDSQIDEMTRWMMLYCSPVSARLASDPQVSTLNYIDPPADTPSAGVRERSCLMETVLNLANEGRYSELSEKRIAEMARVQPEWFAGELGEADRFSSKDDCFLAAFEGLSDGLMCVLNITLGQDSPEGSISEIYREIWPERIYSAIGSMLTYFNTNRLYSKTVTVGAFAAGPSATERNIKLSREVVSILIRRVSPEKPNAFVLDAIAGAIWHIIGYCATRDGFEDSQQIPLMFTDHLAYIVLAPFVGPARAIEAIEHG